MCFVFIAALTHVATAGAQEPAAPFDQAKAVAELRKSIQGKEDQPADDVFMNIKVYKGVTAERLLRIMEFGFTDAARDPHSVARAPGRDWPAIGG